MCWSGMSGITGSRSIDTIITADGGIAVTAMLPNKITDLAKITALVRSNI